MYVFGKRDLDVAEVLIQNDEFFDTVAFHSQKTAEKSIKALELKIIGKVSKRHYLGFLVNNSEKMREVLEKYGKEISLLDQFHTETRYPELIIGSFTTEDRLPSSAEAKLAIKCAKKIFNHIKRY